MRCPVDKDELIILEYDDVEIDYCVRCGGIWLDESELELLLGVEESDAVVLSGGVPAPAPGEKKRRCPICRKAMAKEATQADHPVTYDRCRRGHGLWFDQGELAEVAEFGSAPGKGEQLAAFLKELFADEQEDDAS